MNTIILRSCFVISFLSVLLTISGCGNSVSNSDPKQTAISQAETLIAYNTSQSITAIYKTQNPPATVTLSAEPVQLAPDADAQQPTPIPVPQEIRDELRRLSVNPDGGILHWAVPETQSAQTDDSRESRISYQLVNKFQGVMVADFVLATDVKWFTEKGASGCGFLMRSDGNDLRPNQYLAGITRSHEGHLLFKTQRNGDLTTNDTTDLWVGRLDDRFEWQNNTTNRLVVIGRGDNFQLYSNGILIGRSINGGAGYLSGYVAFIAVQEFGYASCEFSNSYLFEITN